MLTSFRVLDLTDEKGLFCGQLLGNFGADVIKIERPGGDRARNIGPFANNIPNPEKSLFWMAYNTNKRGITLDLEMVDGRKIFKKLVKTSDVVIESFHPGFMEELGLGYSTLKDINPKIILTSISPFGQSGPYRDYKATDLDCWAMGGMLATTGGLERPPSRISHIFASYLIASQDAAFGTAIAHYWRGSSGKGQWVDISIQESVVRTTFMIRESWNVSGQEPKRSYFGHQVGGATITLRKVWKAKDGYVSYMIFGGQLGARRVVQLVEWMDEEGMADPFLKRIDWSALDWSSKTPEEADMIQDCFARFFKTKTKDQLLKGALERRLMIQPLCTPAEILNHPQLKERSYWQTMNYDHLGIDIRYPARCCLPSEIPCKSWRRAPLIGEHNNEIYAKELGYTDEDLAILKQVGVI